MGNFKTTILTGVLLSALFVFPAQASAVSDSYGCNTYAESNCLDAINCIYLSQDLSTLPISTTAEPACYDPEIIATVASTIGQQAASAEEYFIQAYTSLKESYTPLLPVIKGGDMTAQQKTELEGLLTTMNVTLFVPDLVTRNISLAYTEYTDAVEGIHELAGQLSQKNEDSPYITTFDQAGSAVDKLLTSLDSGATDEGSIVDELEDVRARIATRLAQQTTVDQGTKNSTGGAVLSPEVYQGLRSFKQTTINVESVPGLVGIVAGFLLSILGSIALAIYVYAGLLWMVSAGNASRRSQAMSTILWTSIGVVVIFASYAMTVLVTGILE